MRRGTVPPKANPRLARAGINDKEVEHAIGLIAEHRRIEAVLPAAEKVG